MADGFHWRVAAGPRVPRNLGRVCDEDIGRCCKTGEAVLLCFATRHAPCAFDASVVLCFGISEHSHGGSPASMSYVLSEADEARVPQGAAGDPPSYERLNLWYDARTWSERATLMGQHWRECWPGFAFMSPSVLPHREQPPGLITPVQ